MEPYRNRREAGAILAKQLAVYRNRTDVIVLALPRGGVPVAFEIATALHASLDVYIVRKLGVPGHHELAMGAIAMGGVKVLNQDILSGMQITPHEIDIVTEREQNELKRREIAYRGKQPFPILKDKIVILVDDGIATGATMHAAIKAIRQLHPAKLMVAVPVGALETCISMRELVDEFICPLQPEPFYAVGNWYEDFSQTEDEEVHRLLQLTWRGKANG